MTTMLASLFTTAMELSGRQRFFLMLPLCLSIAIVYKAIRNDSMQRFPIGVVGIESRGFILGCPLAYHLNAGFVPVRKPGKLPADVFEVKYHLEYGSNSLAIHRDAIQEGESVLIVDDLLATGGTAAATVHLIRQLGGEIAGVSFLVELAGLNGRRKLDGCAIHSLITYA